MPWARGRARRRVGSASSTPTMPTLAFMSAAEHGGLPEAFPPTPLGAMVCRIPKRVLPTSMLPTLMPAQEHASVGSTSRAGRSRADSAFLFDSLNKCCCKDTGYLVDPKDAKSCTDPENKHYHDHPDRRKTCKCKGKEAVNAGATIKKAEAEIKEAIEGKWEDFLKDFKKLDEIQEKFHLEFKKPHPPHFEFSKFWVGDDAPSGKKGFLCCCATEECDVAKTCVTGHSFKKGEKGEELCKVGEELRAKKKADKSKEKD